MRDNKIKRAVVRTGLDSRPCLVSIIFADLPSLATSPFIHFIIIIISRCLHTLDSYTLCVITKLLNNKQASAFLVDDLVLSWWLLLIYN